MSNWLVKTIRFLLFTFTIAGILLTVAISLLFDSSYYKNALTASGVYEQLPQLVSDLAVRSVTTSEAFSEVEATDEIPAQVNAAVMQLSPQILSPRLMQELVDRNIDHIFAYLNNNEAELTVFIPKTTILSLLDQVSAVFIEIASTGRTTLPLCSDSLLANSAEATIVCIPEGFDKLMPDAETAEAFAQGVSLREVLESQNAFLRDPSEDIVLRQMLIQLNPQFESQQNSPLEVVAKMREGVQLMRILVVLLWGTILLLAVTLWLMQRGEMAERMRKVSSTVALSSGVLLIPALIFSTVIPALISERLTILLSQSGLSLGWTIVLANHLVSSFFMRLSLVSGMILAVSVLLSLGLRVVREKRIQPEAKPIAA